MVFLAIYMVNCTCFLEGKHKGNPSKCFEGFIAQVVVLKTTKCSPERLKKHPFSVPDFVVCNATGIYIYIYIFHKICGLSTKRFPVFFLLFCQFVPINIWIQIR